MIFVLGAAVTQIGFARAGENRRWREWLPALCGFALGIGGYPFALVLLFFAITTLSLGVKRVGGDRGPAFLASAASDLLLAAALSARLASGAAWEFPQPGEWSSGSALAAGAAALRLAGAAASPPGRHSILWWQGSYLASSVAAGAVPVFVVLAVTAFAWTWRRPESHSSSALLVAAGVAVILTAVGAPDLAVVSVGLAAYAFELGSRVVAPWALALLPLSPASWISFAARPPIESRAEVAAAAVFLPLLWAGAITAVVVRPRRAGFGGAPAAGAVACAAFLAGGPYVGKLYPLGIEMLFWLVYAAAAALWVTRLLQAQPAPPVPAPRPEIQRGPGSWVSAAGWVTLAAALALAGRMLAIGMSTRFL